MPSFKVPCPSCEAQVLIKNPNLVGSKVECPKCKYRFKVEAPADEPGKDAAKVEKKGAKAAGEKKTSGKGKNKKMVGIALAIGAVALLGIGGYVMFGGTPTPKPGTSGPGPRPVTPGGDSVNNDGGEGKKDGDNTGKKDDTPPNPLAPRSDREPTNLLPPKSVAVYRFDLGKLRQTPAGGMLFDAATADLVKSSMGFELGDIDQYYHCSVGEKERAPVGVIRLRVPLPEKQLASRVAGAGPTKTVGGKTLIPVTSNPLLSAAGNALAGRTLLSDVYSALPLPPAKAPAYAVCVYDTQTVLVGELAALEAHLAGMKDGYPEFQTVVQKDTAPPAPAPMGMGEMPPATATPPTPTPAPTTGSKSFTNNPTYLSLDPKLRRVLLTMLADPAGPPMFVLAETFDNATYPRSGVRRDYAPIAAALDPVLARTEYLGANLVAFTPRQVVANLRFYGKTDSDARAIALDKLTPTLALALPLLSDKLETQIEFRNAADPNYVPPMESTTPGGFPSGSVPPMGRPGFGMPPTSGMPPGFNGPPMGSLGGPPSTLTSSGQPPMFRPGGEMGIPGMPTDPNRPAVVPSHVTLRLIDEAVVVSVDVSWPDQTYSRLLGPRLLGFVNVLKGKAAVYAGTETWHALGRAVKQYVAERKEYPPGTVPVSRPGDLETRFGVAYPPAQRTSFFVELLPGLGRGGLRQRLDPSKGWLDDLNAPLAGSWVPELLVTYYPQAAWRATTPLAPEYTFGGTNFVAVAGVGLDAPRFNPKDAAKAKQVGLTGYDWGSKVEDVTDGPESTIYLLQTPPGSPRPWAAGGGATVVGLDPDNPMAAFKHTRPDGKQGTYAVMGDGTIRWLPADIDPLVFKALATRAGGEKLPDLDEVAPRVLPAGSKAEMKAESKAAAPAPKSDAAATPAAPTSTPPAPMPRLKNDPVPAKQ